MDVEAQVARIRELQESRLRRHREAAGKSQAEVAEHLGVSQQTVAKWEAANDPGDRWPELAVLYGVKEPYPDAPFNPEKRMQWSVDRAARFQTAREAGLQRSRG